MIILDHKEYWNAVLKDVDQGVDEAMISTFGLWAGVKGTGVVYHSQVTSLLNVLPPKTRIIVGKAMYMPCFPNCEDCKAKYDAYLKRIGDHVRYWGIHDWKITDCMHLKLILFRKGKTWHGWSGGRNLSSSTWADAGIKLEKEDAKSMVSAFNTLWTMPDCSLVE